MILICLNPFCLQTNRDIIPAIGEFDKQICIRIQVYSLLALKKR